MSKRCITFNDLNIAKVNRRVRMYSCSKELDAYLSAMASVNEDADKVPKYIQQSFLNCMAGLVS
jgi:hypothetical protein